MNEEHTTLDRRAVRQELNQARLALQKCEQKTQSGADDEDGPLAMVVDFQQLLMHLCFSWHFKHLTHEQIRALTQESFDRLANTVSKSPLLSETGVPPEATKRNSPVQFHRCLGPEFTRAANEFDSLERIKL